MYCICESMGNQWREARWGEMWSILETLRTRRAALFSTICSLFRRYRGHPKRTWTKMFYRQEHAHAIQFHLFPRSHHKTNLHSTKHAHATQPWTWSFLTFPREKLLKYDTRLFYISYKVQENKFALETFESNRRHHDAVVPFLRRHRKCATT